MESFVGSFDDRIVGLTGDGAADRGGRPGIRRLQRTPRHGPRPDDYVIDHSTYIYIMDPQGQFVRGLDVGTSG